MGEITEDPRNLEGLSGRKSSSVTRPHFFKIFLPMYLEELPIPRKFVRKCRKELSDFVLLKGPRGTVWRVGLKETDGIIYFLDGWKEFIKHHFLCIGYLLVFRYDGNSQFNVQIFDKSACEKEYLYASENYEESCSKEGSCTPAKGSDDCIEIKGEGRAVHLTDRRDNDRVSPNRGSCTPGKEGDDCIEIKGEGRGVHLTESRDNDLVSPNRGSCTPEKEIDDCIAIKGEGRGVHLTESRDNDHVSPSKGSCTPEKQSEDSIEILGVSRVEVRNPTERTYRRVRRRYLHQNFQSNAKKMKKSNCETMSKDNNQQINRTNDISQSESRNSTSGKYFGSENLQQEKPQDHLLSPQQSCHIRFVQSNGKGSVESIQKNLSNFSKEKTHSEPIPMDLENQSTESCMPLSGENFSVIPKTEYIEPDDTSSCSEHTEYSQEQSESIMPSNGRFHGRLVSKKRDVTPEQKRMTLLQATKFKSNNPFFLTVMRPSYVNRSPRMHMPLNFVRDHFPSRPPYIILESSDRQIWPVGCRYRNNGTLLMSRGWARFLSENNIEEGDVCVFELVKRKSNRLRVIIYRVDDLVPLIQLKLAAKRRKCK